MAVVHLLFLLVALIISAAFAQSPWQIIENVSGSPILANAIYNQYVIGKNYTSTDLHMLNCNGVNPGNSCNLEGIISQPGVQTFGNKIAYGQSFLVASAEIGYLYTYSCDTSPLSCTLGNILYTGGNSDPISLFHDNTISCVVFATYSNYLNKGPALVAIDCCNPTNCYIFDTVFNFVQDCLDAPGYTDDCLAYGPIGPNIVATSSLLLVIVGFPNANGGRGGALIYDCFTGNCSIQGQVPDTYNFFGSFFKANENFASSLAINYEYDGVFNLVIGVPGAAISNGYQNENYLANYNTGGFYMYYCSFSDYYYCAHYKTVSFSGYDVALYGQCAYTLGNLGAQSQLTYSTVAFVSSPNYCDHQGGYFIVHCSYYYNYCNFDDYYYLNYYNYYYANLPGSQSNTAYQNFGSELYASGRFIISNTNQGSFIDYNPYNYLMTNITSDLTSHSQFLRKSKLNLRDLPDTLSIVKGQTTLNQKKH